jgi:hypothetical protein
MRIVGISALLLGGIAAPVQAGVLADDLSRCFVVKATASDNAAIMAWMFSAIASDPKLEKYTTLDRQKRDGIAAAAGAVFQRLLLVDCRTEAVAAIKAEGRDAMTKPFGALGAAATEQMFRSPEAQTELESLDKGFDKEKLKALGREAGLPDEKPSK